MNYSSATKRRRAKKSSFPRKRRAMNQSPTLDFLNLSQRARNCSYTLVEEDSMQDSDSDGSVFRWDEEASLLSELMEDEPKPNSKQHLDDLADSLEKPFREKGKQVKQKIAQTLVPTHNHVKAVFKVIDKHMDTSYGQGITTYDEASEDIERVLYAQQADFEESYEKSCTNIERLLEELKGGYAARDNLWVDLKYSIDKIVTPTLAKIKATPANVENTIAKLEKHAKSWENSTVDMNSVRKGLLQDLLR